MGYSIDLGGRVAIVTGASRGLGEAVTLALTLAGAHVVAIARDSAKLADTVAQVEERGGTASSVCCDVTDEVAVDEAVAEIVARHGRIDILVNNAGIAIVESVVDMSLDNFQAMMATNVTGSFLMARAVGRSMIDQGGGKIINIGSIDAIVGAAGLVGYCASKGAVVQLTRGLAVEWARHNIQVNCLCPGYFVTDINRDDLEDELLRRKVLARIPQRRFGELNELVHWVTFLSSPASDYTTGQVLVVDGGQSAN